jgi:hypothetical protein
MNNTTYSNPRPITVTAAIILLALNSGAATACGILNGPWDLTAYYYIFGFDLILDFVPLWFVFRRKNWARWFVAIFTFAYLCYDPFLWMRDHKTFSAWFSAWFILSDTAEIAALVLLFHPSSNNWFRRPKQPTVIGAESTQAGTGS